MSCDVGEVTESLENEPSSFSKLSAPFTYITAHSPTLPSLYLRHNSFSNPSIASPTSQLILIVQSFSHFTYATAHSPTLPSLYLLHKLFSNPSVASLTSPGEPSTMFCCHSDYCTSCFHFCLDTRRRSSGSCCK